ncbi:helix-turn-helix domain-containing protein [Actinoplanes sp. CA-030573]|uniref:helix-turn-helix domain-containing protein n=1 Tax=Actinoplanes sp. CA-030573 TaxID=3239898 RepID=UPI003D9424EE
MLADLLSDNAHNLYDRLVASGGCPESDILDHERTALRELVRQGLVFRTPEPVPRYSAVPPMTAMLRLLDDEQQLVLRAHRRLIERYSALERLERRAARLQVITDAEAARSAAHDLAARAREWCVLVQGPHLGLDQPDCTRPGVRHRHLIDRSLLATSTCAEVRALPEVPAPMLVTDAAALLCLGPMPEMGMLLIHGGSLVESLARYFDLLWAQAVPFGGTAPADGPSEVQLRILRLAATGLKDEAIARAMGRSVRWVRRHFELLEERLGATNRLTLGIAASRRDWV